MSNEQEAAERVARQLHAIASPVRIELMEALRFGGVQSTAELARRLPDARGGIQATLSDMADAGWVRLVDGTGRSARWSAVDNPVTWSDVGLDDERVRVAQAAVEQAARQRRFTYIRAFEHEWQTGAWPSEWADVVMSRDYVELMIPEELAELDSELHAAVERARSKAHTRRAEAKDSGGRSDGIPEEPVFLTMMAFPRRGK